MDGEGKLNVERGSIGLRKRRREWEKRKGDG